MAISEDIIKQLTPQLRGVAFPIDQSTSPERVIDEASTFNVGGGAEVTVPPQFIDSPAGETIDSPAELAGFSSVPSMESRCIWKAKVDDIANYGDPTVIRCELIDATVFDSEVKREILNNQMLQISGQYGFDTFPNVTYKYKDAENNKVISGSGLPFPNDPNFKNLIEIQIDPQANKDVFYTIDFVVEFDYAQVAFDFVNEILLERGDAILRDGNTSVIGEVTPQSGSFEVTDTADPKTALGAYEGTYTYNSSTNEYVKNSDIKFKKLESGVNAGRWSLEFFGSTLPAFIRSTHPWQAVWPTFIGKFRFDTTNIVNSTSLGRLVQESSQRQTDVPIITTPDSPEDSDLDGVINYDLYVEGTKAYRRDRFLFNQTLRNFSGERLSDLLKTII